MTNLSDISTAAKPLLDEYGFNSAILFGSYATGEIRENSDVDLLIDVPKNTKPKSVFAFAYDLSEAIGVQVDAYGSNEIDEESNFYREIILKGIKL